MDRFRDRVGARSAGGPLGAAAAAVSPEIRREFGTTVQLEDFTGYQRLIDSFARAQLAPRFHRAT